MLSLGEIERIARLLYSQNTKQSAWPLLVLIELSKSDDWQYLSELVDRVYKKKCTGQDFFFKTLMENNLVEMEKESSSTSIFPRWKIKLSPQLHTLSQDSYDISVVENLLDIAKSYMSQFSRTSMLLILVLLAIKVRKFTEVKEVYAYVGAKYRTEDKILNKLAQLGVIQLVKTGEYKKAPLAIFEVE